MPRAKANSYAWGGKNIYYRQDYVAECDYNINTDSRLICKGKINIYYDKGGIFSKADSGFIGGVIELQGNGKVNIQAKSFVEYDMEEVNKVHAEGPFSLSNKGTNRTIHFITYINNVNNKAVAGYIYTSQS